MTETAMPSAVNDWTVQQITAQKHTENPSNLKFSFLQRKKTIIRGLRSAIVVLRDFH